MFFDFGEAHEVGSCKTLVKLKVRVEYAKGERWKWNQRIEDRQREFVEASECATQGQLSHSMNTTRLRSPGARTFGIHFRCVTHTHTPSTCFNNRHGMHTFRTLTIVTELTVVTADSAVLFMCHHSTCFLFKYHETLASFSFPSHSIATDCSRTIPQVFMIRVWPFVNLPQGSTSAWDRK